MTFHEFGQYLLPFPMSIKGRMFNFIESVITNRYLSVNVNGFSSNKLELENGIPQGSVLAPILTF